MNRNLLVFSLLLFLLGIGLGAYILSFLGLLLLIPSLFSSARPPVQRAPPQPTQQPKRVAPRAPPQTPATAPHHPQETYLAGLESPPQQQAYSSAVFPTVMLPSLFPMAAPAQPVREMARGKMEERDELVEVGAILAMLKLVFG